MKTSISKYTKYASVMTSAMLLTMVIGIATVSAQTAVGVNTSATVRAGMKAPGTSFGIGARIGLRASTTMRISSTTMRMGSTSREQMIANRQGQAIGKVDTKAGQLISARISSLDDLSTRLNAMKNISANEKTTLSSEIQSLTSELTGLQAKIQADASSTPTGTRGDLGSSSPLRQDSASISKDYRVYALVIPQVEILAAADRVNTLVTSLTTLSAKLQTRLTAAQSVSTTGGAGLSGSSLTSLQASLTDLNAKIADAQIQATAAVSAVSNLTPDNGDTTVAASNETALKSGRTAIQTATTDIQAADKDAHTIVFAVEKLSPVTGSANASTSVSSQ